MQSLSLNSSSLQTPAMALVLVRPETETTGASSSSKALQEVVVKLAEELGAGLTIVAAGVWGACAGRSSAESPILWSATPTVPCSW